jgi:predicted site-specific integrase-resolvase
MSELKPAFVPIENVARHFSVSISTIRAWLRQGTIAPDTFIKVGNTYRFNLPAVEASLIGGSANKNAALAKVHVPEEYGEEQLELDFDLDEDV